MAVADGRLQRCPLVAYAHPIGHEREDPGAGTCFVGDKSP